MRLQPPPPDTTPDPHSSHPPNDSISPSSSLRDDSEMDAEIDQLDSDSDQDAIQSLSSKDKNGPARTERAPGCSLLPTARLENILQADGVTGNLALSKEALFVLSIATEEFIKRMAQAGHIHATAQRRNAVQYIDMDTIPTPIPLSDAMQFRLAKEKEMLEDNPALAMSATTTSALYPVQNGVTSKPRGKGRTNGHEKSNGNISPVPQPERHLAEHLMSDRNGNKSNAVNGHMNPSWVNFSNGALSSGYSTPFTNNEGQLPSHVQNLPGVSNDNASRPHSPNRPVHSQSNTLNSLNPLNGTWLRGPGLIEPDHVGRTIYSRDRQGE
ncbi:hypothetical protein AMATHDRAFT_702 [Amanita thiersii Skay4041]|uniref:Transcription factor CBF/NF-Y/archaeal histone domain-containing protein n=1 Tax=Amanita thiersii Skay4041 TaxID=703135 RepID=A0A2A9NTM6_9AGAR|nr:hypothetical protein AMATHDRAFT_702 [Amanita thiersii Skay4041]